MLGQQTTQAKDSTKMANDSQAPAPIREDRISRAPSPPPRRRTPPAPRVIPPVAAVRPKSHPPNRREPERLRHALASFAPSAQAVGGLPLTDDDISNAFNELGHFAPQNQADSGVRTAVVDMGTAGVDSRGAGAALRPSYRSPSIPPRTVSLAPSILADCDSTPMGPPVKIQRRQPEVSDQRYVMGAVAAGVSFLLGIGIIYLVQEPAPDDDGILQPVPEQADEPSAADLPGASLTSDDDESADIAEIRVLPIVAASGNSDVVGETAEIRLVGLPEGTKIFLNGAPAKLPLRVKRSNESVKIEARAPGYGKVVKRIVPSSDKTVLIRMAPR